MKYQGKLSRITSNGKSPFQDGQPSEVTGYFYNLPQNGSAFAIHADHSQSTLYPEGFYRMTSIVNKVGPWVNNEIEFVTDNSTYILSEIKEIAD